MCNCNSGGTDNGEERGDRLAVSQEIAAIFDQFELADSLFQSFSENLKPCFYYSAETRILSNSNINIFIFHVNIRSSQKNFESLSDLLNTCTKYPNIICLIETRIQKSPYMNVTLSDYELLYFNSPTNAGGVAIYIFQKTSRFNQ